MSRQGFKQQLFEQFARVGKALANGHRLELLEHLAQGERTVEALAEVAGLSVANASQHLQHLRRAGLVAARKNGLHVHYRLADPAAYDLLGAMQRLAERQSGEVDRIVRTYLTAKDALEPVSRTDLLERTARGDVTVLDVRPPEEYAAGHLPDALNVPLRSLEAELGRLPRRQEVVAYCRGPYCVLAFEAVARLRALGYRARRLQGGFPEWKSADLPVEEGATAPKAAPRAGRPRAGARS
ncbi:MAG: metalloregulator ArsR/SmtB family transcription factor [Burkholderiales bacterium]|nr:metalloregulator ArsR/SmtB family transcription factor [Burkholderiales bacterium]